MAGYRGGLFARTIIMPKQSNKKDLLQTPKGTRDILPQDIPFWEFVESKAREIAMYYGFKPIRTPHIEKSEIFLASLGDTSDVVEKQIYAFRTRGGDALALRPEGTVPAMRSFIEHGMQSWPQPVMLTYSGSFFRHESPQKGRFREFGQVGFEIIGEEGAIADATVIRLVTLIILELNIGQFNLHINTLGDKVCRPNYRKELVNYYRRKINYLCKDCKRRLKLNPFRLLDCQEEKCVEMKKDAPQMIEYVCDGCKKHFREVLEYLDKLAVPYYLNPYLVRGLDYYSRTVFEIFSDQAVEAVKIADAAAPEKPVESESESKIVIPAADKPENAVNVQAPGLALASGGRYDYLAEMLGGKKIPGVGAAMGVDRLVEELSKKRPEVAKIGAPKLFLIQLGPLAKQQSLVLLEEFRKMRLSVASSLAKDSLKAQLRIADIAGAQFALILGQKEAIDGTIIIRDMRSGVQETVLQTKIVEHLKRMSKNK